MIRKNLLTIAAALLMVAPAASQASDLSRRLTIRYPGQDAKHRRHDPLHVFGHRDRRDDRRHDRRDDRPRDDRRHDDRR